MRLSLVILFLYLSISSYGQRPPLPNLPSISVEDAGFNRDSINVLYDRVENFEHRDFKGYVVIKDHQIVMEWYFNSFWRNHIHDVRSAGKSITSLLLGVAIKEGLVESLDQDVYSFFSKEKYPSLHEDYKRVKIKHLLDMASGLNADSDDWDTPGHAGQWVGSDEWVAYILSIPLAEEPGTRFVYADINAALIGAIIEEKSGMSLRDFAQEKVFTPLGIKEFYWYTNAANQTVAAGTLYLSTLDFAKLGVLVTNEGKWAGEQIVQAEYIERLIAHRAFDLSDWWWITDAYGMLWYKKQDTFNGKEIDYLFASGFGGNHLVVVPEENLVIALTAYAYGRNGASHARSYSILRSVLNALE